MRRAVSDGSESFCWEGGHKTNFPSIRLFLLAGAVPSDRTAICPSMRDGDPRDQRAASDQGRRDQEIDARIPRAVGISANLSVHGNLVAWGLRQAWRVGASGSAHARRPSLLPSAARGGWGAQAAFFCSMLVTLLPLIAIRRGFMASGISRTRSIINSPFWGGPRRLCGAQ